MKRLAKNASAIEIKGDPAGALHKKSVHLEKRRGLKPPGLQRAA
jgi:hypothetical protein